MLQSIVQQRGSVSFPVNTGERVYMREIRKAVPLPAHLQRWQSTIDAMLHGVDTDGPIYLMIDQGTVKANQSQRRPGLHIDGYWIPSLQAWGGGGSEGQWKSAGGHDSGGGGHRISCDDWKDEAIILASDISASRAMAGFFNGLPGDGGDCSHIDVSNMDSIRLQANTCYAGNVLMLHESLPVDQDCTRTLVRLNVPGWTPKLH